MIWIRTITIVAVIIALVLSPMSVSSVASNPDTRIEAPSNAQVNVGDAVTNGSDTAIPSTLIDGFADNESNSTANQVLRGLEITLEGVQRTFGGIQGVPQVNQVLQGLETTLEGIQKILKGLQGVVQDIQNAP